MIIPGGIQQRSGVSYPMNSTSSNRSAHALLIAEVLDFVRAARHVSGINRIALIGSLTTNQPHPNDADLLVSVTQDADLAPLARLSAGPGAETRVSTAGATSSWSILGGIISGASAPGRGVVPGFVGLVMLGTAADATTRTTIGTRSGRRGT